MTKNTHPLLWTIWWNSIDKYAFTAVIGLICIGTWLIMAVSPSIALQHHWSPFVLLKRHLVMVIPGIILMILVSFFMEKTMIYTAKGIFICAWIGIWMTLVLGAEIKGARRWLSIMGFSLQPSEFLKPALAIILAELLAQGRSFFIIGGVALAAAVPLFLQPDLGMIAVTIFVTFAQCFIAGLPWVLTGFGIFAAGIGGLAIYVCFPHAASRIQAFLSGDAQDPFGSQYQILQAMKSFASGGVFGRGPGAGVVLNALPDGHADFIFAAAGEELGMLVCLCIIGLYALIIIRGLSKVLFEKEPFFAIATTGLVAQFAIQTSMNMASVLRLMPTKGVTLPFMSYGGSSFLSMCWAMGMIFALTRRYRYFL